MREDKQRYSVTDTVADTDTSAAREGYHQRGDMNKAPGVVFGVNI